MNYVYVAAIAFAAGVVVSHLYYARVVAELKADAQSVKVLAVRELQDGLRKVGLGK